MPPVRAAHTADVSEPAEPARAHGAPDGVQLLTVYVFVLLAVPSRLTFAPLGSAGTPAQIIGLGLAVWWVAMAISARPDGDQWWTRARLSSLAFLGSVMLSYVAAATRPIDAGELRSADLGVVSTISWLGVFLVAYDHIRSRGAVNVLLRRIVLGAGAVATLGICQFVFKQPFTNYIQIPGLSENSALTSVLTRGSFTRPAGTALHPIEFGAVLTMILPVALHYALHDRERPLIRRWYPAAALCIAIPISISRSAIVSAVLVLCIVMPTWARPLRRRAYGAMVVLGAVLYVLVPGLLGTLTGLFTGISGDSSAQSRTGSYGLAMEFIADSPFIGRGQFTFLPSYRILDNQYLLSLIEIGVVGVLALLTLFGTSIASSIAARRRYADPASKSLAHSLTASIAAAAVSFALFDAFSFPMVPGLMFLLLGCIGAVSRASLVRDGSTPAGYLGSSERPSPS